MTICIPSYNRPEELYRLLESIDISSDKSVEVLICEDKAPRRQEVAEKVKQFIGETELRVEYHENEKNLGFDKNLRECITTAKGKWILFMGDDDCFIPGVLDDYYDFLVEHDELHYILRSYRRFHSDGKVEYYRYYSDNKFFKPGFDTYMALFRKSVFISGFTFRKDIALETLTDRFDGTLLYQLYVLAEICLNKPAAYYNTPITEQYDGGTPYFGNSESEKDLYTPGTVTIENSINFMRSWFQITDYIDEKYKVQSSKALKKEWSKYSYPVLAIQRKRGRKEFKEYHKRLCEIGFNKSGYYYIYYIGLYLFGEKFCDKVIRGIKKVLGRTPKL
ncbi:MAG: glycosyltransferase [Lachnospiraceae bacterium]|nr:glycosyltransferase [Lachnospiraceae bacterium]